MKSIKIILNLVKTYFLQQKRSKGETFWIYAFPLFLFIFLGLIFGGMYDNDSSILTFGVEKSIVEAKDFSALNLNGFLSNQEYIQVKYFDDEEGRKSILENQIEAFIVRNSDGNSFDIVVSEKNQQINSIIATIFDQVNLEAIKRQTGIEVPIKYNFVSASHQGITFTYIYFLLAGMIAISLMQNALFSIPAFILEFKRMGFIKRFNFSPLKKYQFTLSIVIQRLITALIQLGLLLIAASLVFKVKLSINIIPFLVTFILGISAFIILGFLIAALFKKVESANNFAQIVNMMLMFTAGVYFPIAAMPKVFQYIAYSNPIYYYAKAIYGTMLLNQGFSYVYKELLVLAGIFVVTLVATLFTFKYDAEA